MAPLLRGIAAALQGHPLDSAPPTLRAWLALLRTREPKNLLVLEILARMKDSEAAAALRAIVPDEAETVATRLKAIELLQQVRDPQARDLFLEQFAVQVGRKSDPLLIGLLAGLESFDHDAIGMAVLARYSACSPSVKRRALQLLLSRPNWAIVALKEYDAGNIPRADLSIDLARSAIGLGDKAVTAIVEKHFGKLAPATAGEKQARIGGLNIALGKEKGDLARGKAVFTRHCAACHALHGEGARFGPDLTTADRKNRMYLLTNIIDPSGYIRPEYVAYSVLTADDRKLLGLVADSAGGSISVLNVLDNRIMKTTVAKADIVEMRPSPISLMPEKLLDTLTEAEVADLFAYLASDPPGKDNSPKPPKKADGETGKGKKLKVVLVSGSFEYKSDDSLAILKKHWEANFPVECVLVSAKAEKDRDFPGIEALDGCDLAVFFTRRLQVDGKALESVKRFAASRKPVIGIRTASHGFQNWLEMDKEVYGGDYRGHFGAGMAEVKLAETGKDHPILKGVGSIKTKGSLYKNPKLAADVRVLLLGAMGKESEPVAWVREKDGRRVFYTSLGHAEDFQDETFLRLLSNGLAWATKSEWAK
jgi:putative heme-binding domain-containing protein